MIKKAAICVYLFSGYVALRDIILSLLGKSRATVLYYHRIGDSRDPLTRSLSDFRNDLSYLQKHYECISFADLRDRLQSARAFRRRAVVITFDDGYRDNYTEAARALKEAGMTATFFVATGYIGTDRQFPHDECRDEVAANSPKLTWDDLRAMQREGFEIGSHTVNHTNLGSAGRESVRSELNESLATLNRELGVRERPFSFPWGKPEDFSEAAIRLVKNAGYYSACSAYGGTNSRGTDPFRIQRVDAGNGLFSLLAFRARVSGLDPEYIRSRLRSLAGRRRRVTLAPSLPVQSKSAIQREGS